MEQFQEGTVFELFENDPQEYIILKKLNLDEKIYLVVVPVDGEQDNLKMNTKKLLLLKVNGVNDIEIEADDTIIRKVVDNLF